VDRIGDEAAPLIRVLDALHDAQRSPRPGSSNASSDPRSKRL
jgi:hypothetical protein